MLRLVRERPFLPFGYDAGLQAQRSEASFLASRSILATADGNSATGVNIPRTRIVVPDGVD